MLPMSGKWVYRSVAFVLLLETLAPAGSAPLSCSQFTAYSGNEIRRPKPPICLTFLLPDQADDLCRLEMETYISKVRNYTECLADERAEAVAEANRSIESFNCAVRGGIVC